ncbi:PIN domain-containing protein [Candidatus Poribacteria bacterium]|nr:PIN domain-containing protein [Candidatus Poribacteria bacterium]
MVRKPILFLDADVLIAGSGATSGASHIILQLSKLTIIDCITSKQAQTEAERNLMAKLPLVVPTFRQLLDVAVKMVDDPLPQKLQLFQGQANPKDLPILTAAILNDCDYLVTFNVRHYYPASEDIVILQPGEFLERVRILLTNLVG